MGYFKINFTVWGRRVVIPSEKPENHAGIHQVKASARVENILTISAEIVVENRLRAIPNIVLFFDAQMQPFCIRPDIVTAESVGPGTDSEIFKDLDRPVVA